MKVAGSSHERIKSVVGDVEEEVQEEEEKKEVVVMVVVVVVVAIIAEEKRREETLGMPQEIPCALWSE